METGMTVARYNITHGDFEEQRNRIKNIRAASKKLGKTVAILLNTKGPEIRTGVMAEDKVDIVKGQSINITMDETFLGRDEEVAITYPNEINDVQVGSNILLGDGHVKLEVTDILKDTGEIETKASNKG